MDQCFQTPHCSGAWDCDPTHHQVNGNENRIIPHLTGHGGKRGAEWFSWTSVRNVWEGWEHTTLLQSPGCGSVAAGASGTWPSPPSWVGSGTQKFTPALLHKSTAGVNCFMPLLVLRHLIYNGNCVRLQTGHFPALPGCDNLKASQPLCWKSLTAIESSKENKEAKSLNFSQLCEIRVQSSTPSVEQNAPKKDLLILSRTKWFYSIPVIIPS